MIYLITKIDDEDVVIGELTGYSMFSGILNNFYRNLFIK